MRDSTPTPPPLSNPLDGLMLTGSALYGGVLYQVTLVAVGHPFGPADRLAYLAPERSDVRAVVLSHADTLRWVDDMPYWLDICRRMGRLRVDAPGIRLAVRAAWGLA